MANDARVPERLFDDPAREATWRRRFTAAVVTPPIPARQRPEHNVYVSNSSGTFQVHAWNRVTDEHWEVTTARHGAYVCALSADGRWIWYFTDPSGAETGRWHRVRFPAPGRPLPEPEETPITTEGFPLGQALGVSRGVVAMMAADGCTLWYYDEDKSEVSALLHDSTSASVHDLDPADELAVVSHAAGASMLRPTVSVLALGDGREIGRKWDGADHGLEVFGFSPVPGDRRILMAHERDGNRVPFIWNLDDDSETSVEADLAGETWARWFPGASALLLGRSEWGRTSLYRYDLARHGLDRIPVRTGWIGAAAARQDASIEYVWCDAAHPPEVRRYGTDGSDRVLLCAPGEPAPPSRRVLDAFVDVDGPAAGRLHVLYATPDSPGPWPTVFSVHGGPYAADEDYFSAIRATWLDAGFAVVHANYRGSTGYGRSWREAIKGDPGCLALDDLGSAHDWAVAHGVADPRRCVLRGWSWGGYLALLGVGRQPRRWAAGIAGAPIADYVAAYREQLPSLRHFDDELFGGGPDDVPEVYVRSSPLTYVPRVVAPVLLLCGDHDPRTPPGQLARFEEAMAEHDRYYEKYTFDAGHGSLEVEEQIRQCAVEIGFAVRHLGSAGTVDRGSGRQ
ncbi:alpha/beta hydrolase family protein [Amycolatopsis suaedae]|uniref:alpha/beta hydrolase family protein n=1 Tax=Amycolatopsis suaedae TaxID=2510978 RepID=UPI001F0E8805|nr:prolyl oligopeptidase family serine peptidase [Amycolatopsis suaedae]